MELREALDRVRPRIGQHGRPRQLNEENTKATLIDPIVRALGWDPEDFEEVQREYKRRARDKPVDYALLVLRTPRLFIEAKALGQNLDDRKWAGQIMGYAAVAGVEWVVLTDGDEYRIYNSHASVPVEDKLFRKIRVSDLTSASEETLDLLSKTRMQENRIEVLWKAHFVDRGVRAAIEDLVAPDADPALVRLIRKRTPKLSAKEVRESLARARINLDFPIDAKALVRVPKSPRVGKQTASKGLPAQRKAPETVGVSIQMLIQEGILRPPVDLKRRYKGRDLTARIESDGSVACQGKSYNSLSVAAGAARAVIIGMRPDGQYPPTNGWSFWTFLNSHGKHRPIDDLRQEFLKHRKAI